MDEPSVNFEPFVDEAVRQFVVNGVDNHNIAATGMAAYFPANFILRSGEGDVVGGLLGYAWGGWLYVSHLWVAEMVRRQGHGARLLAAAEAYAKSRGCVAASLETHSFQNRPFYERCGYEVFATLADNPVGHAKFFLQKRLAG